MNYPFKVISSVLKCQVMKNTVSKMRFLTLYQFSSNLEASWINIGRLSGLKGINMILMGIGGSGHDFSARLVVDEGI